MKRTDLIGALLTVLLMGSLASPVATQPGEDGPPRFVASVVPNFISDLIGSLPVPNFVKSFFGASTC